VALGVSPRAMFLESVQPQACTLEGRFQQSFRFLTSITGGFSAQPDPGHAIGML